VLYSFDGTNNSAGPNGNLAIDSAGNIFGVASGAYYGVGMVYELSLSKGQWVLTTIYNFGGGATGEDPNGGIILDSAGNLYGSTGSGGNNNAGEVFELKHGKPWRFEMLYSFSGNGNDSDPNSGLTFGPGRGLYGTTDDSNDQSDGEVFEILP